MSSKPAEQVTPDHDDAENGEVLRDQGLCAGAVLDHGRYRLLAQVGSDDRCAAQLWRAKDGVLGRDVALTILTGDRSDSQAATNARKTLERAMHASTFNHVGVARVLDVVTQSPGDPAGVLGVVIAEWTHGTDLLDLIEEGPLPPGTAARLLQPLAAAVEAAHHAGLVLGSDHPQRIRVTRDGEIRMGFPGPLPQATSTDDVHGLGAALYLLLTGRWALPGGPSGIPSAPSGPDGTVVAPRTLRPTVPMELSTVAVRALGSPDATGTTGGVRTGAAVLRVLEQQAKLETSGAGANGPGTEVDTEVWRTEDPTPDQVKRKKLTISVGILSLVTLIVLGWITASVAGILTGQSKSSGPSVVLGPDGHTQVQPGPAPPAPAMPIPITAGKAFNPSNQPDSPRRVNYLFDGDPSTYWTTADYFQQLGPGGYASGSGVVLSLASPTVVRQVTIDSPSPGTRVEIRAASSDNPDLNASPVIGVGELTGGKTTIQVGATEPTQHLIIWVTKLAPHDGKFASQFNEVTVSGSPH